MGEELVSSWGRGVSMATPVARVGDQAALGTAPPRLGQQHLTRGFTSSFPVTVNMVERPKGVHTVGGGEADRGVPQHPAPPHAPRRVLNGDGASALHHNSSRPRRRWQGAASAPAGHPGGTCSQRRTGLRGQGATGGGPRTHAAAAAPRRARCRSRGRAGSIPRGLRRHRGQAGGTGHPSSPSAPQPGPCQSQESPSTPWKHPPHPSSTHHTPAAPTVERLAAGRVVADDGGGHPDHAQHQQRQQQQHHQRLVHPGHDALREHHGIRGEPEAGGPGEAPTGPPTFLDPANPSDSVKK